MNPAALKLARRWLASEVFDNNSTKADRDACYAGLYDDDPRFPELLKAAERKISCMGGHGERTYVTEIAR